MLEKICSFVSLSSKALCIQLKQHLDVIAHLCRDKKFLEQNLQSLSPNLNLSDSALSYPPKLFYFEFYLASVEAAFSALIQFNIANKATYSDPIEEAILELKRIPQVSSFINEQNFTKQLRDFTVAVQAKDIAVPLQKLVLNAKGHKQNTPIRAFFETMQSKKPSFSLYTGILNLVKEISKPWALYISGFDSSLTKCENQVETACANVKASIRAATAKLKKDRSIDKKVKDKITNVLKVIGTCIARDDYRDYINACLADPMRMPLFSSQKMTLFFELMNLFNTEFNDFEKNLLIVNQKVVPCRAFFAFDLFFHHIFKNVPTEIVKGPFIKLTSFLPSITNKSFLISQNINQNELSMQFVDYLYKFCDVLIPFQKEEQLVCTIRSLKTFLERATPVTVTYVLQTLFKPLSQHENIDERSVSLIKEFYASCFNLLKSHNLESNFFIIEKELIDELNKCTPERKFYLKLNLAQNRLLKFQLKAFYKLIEKHDGIIKKCTTSTELVSQFRIWDKELCKIMKQTGGNEHVKFTNILALVAHQEGLDHLSHALREVGKWKCLFCYFEQTFTELAKMDPTSAVSGLAPPKIEEIASDWDSEEDVSIEISEEEFTPQLQTDLHLDSPYATQCDLINKLKLQHLKPLSLQEHDTSYLFRTIKRQEALANISFYLTLLEEQQDNEMPELMKARRQIDQLILLEATEKVALCSLRIGTKEEHITSLKFGLNFFSHNGELLVSMIKAVAVNWFKEIEEVIPYQENQLKTIYWFQKDPQIVPGIAAVRSSCENVWKNVADLPSSKTFTFHVKEYSLAKERLHKIKRKQNTPVLPHFTFDMDVFKAKLNLLSSSDNVASMKRVCSAYDLLQESDLTPLHFCLRSSEIQVSILSLSLQMALAKYQVDQDTKLDQRPLKYTHRVDKLFAFLKEMSGENPLEEYLPLFVGDPRYPYPNKTLLTADLVTMQKKVHLLIKLREGGFLSKKEQKMLHRHLGKEGKGQPLHKQEAILKQSIEVMLKKQKEKTAFAFYLAEQFSL